MKIKSLRNLVIAGTIALFGCPALTNEPTQEIFNNYGHFTATKFPNKLVIKHNGYNPDIKTMHDYNPKDSELDSMSNGSKNITFALCGQLRGVLQQLAFHRTHFLDG